jgi:hypothetical protein
MATRISLLSLLPLKVPRRRKAPRPMTLTRGATRVGTPSNAVGPGSSSPATCRNAALTEGCTVGREDDRAAGSDPQATQTGQARARPGKSELPERQRVGRSSFVFRGTTQGRGFSSRRLRRLPKLDQPVAHEPAVGVERDGTAPHAGRGELVLDAARSQHGMLPPQFACFGLRSPWPKGTRGLCWSMGRRPGKGPGWEMGVRRESSRLRKSLAPPAEPKPSARGGWQTEKISTTGRRARSLPRPYR